MSRKGECHVPGRRSVVGMRPHAVYRIFSSSPNGPALGEVKSHDLRDVLRVENHEDNVVARVSGAVLGGLGRV